MTIRRSHTIALLAAAAALVCAAVPGRAVAATGPVSSPLPIVSEGFEGAAPSRLALDWLVPSPGDPKPAFWGPVTQRRHAGLRGLWCAGAVPGSTALGWTKYGGTYPDYTAGMAVFDLPELGDFYSATLDYWYQMPSVGSADGDALNVLWSSTAGGDFWDFHAGWPVSAGWTHVVMDLTAPTPPGFSRPVDLSRTPGKVEFLFRDDTSAFEAPSTGEGPTIDDVVVAGYKFGPVRGLQAAVGDSGVHLAWERPARSTAVTAPDEERPVAYRVWRSPDTLPYAWTELSVARISGTTYDDPDPLPGSSRYVVQAWDPATGPGYGEVSVPGGTAHVFIGSPPPAPVSSISVSPAAPDGPDGVYVTTPTVTVTRNVDGMTYWRWDSGPFAPTSAASFEVPSLPGTHTLEVYSVNGADVTEAPVLSRVVKVNVPPARTRPVLSTPKLSVTTPMHGRAFYVRGSLGPKHAAATTVRVYVYRRVGTAYRSYRTYTVKVAAGATAYSQRTSLPLRGTFRVRTYHTDADHLPTYSAYRTFKVK